MDHEPDDELRALRKRAYGRDADIDGDPVALRRLRELEEEAHRRHEDAPAPAESVAVHPDPAEPTTEVAPHAKPEWDRPGEPEPEPPGVPEPASRAGERPEPDEPEPEHPRASSQAWWRRRSTLLWSAAVLGALAIGAAAALWAVQPHDRVAVLQPADVDDWPRNVVGEPPDGSRLFEDFLGLTVVVMPQSFGGGQEIDCLYVLESGGQGFMTTIGCSAGNYPATAALPVTARAPEELRARFADGTALRFVLDGARVHVHADEP